LSQYDVLREMFLAGHFVPGEQLIPGRLSQLLGVSRTPVREALALFERDGVVRQTTRGYVVVDPSSQELMEILEARGGLDSYAASLAAQKRTPLDIARINEITQFKIAGLDAARQRRMHEMFHQAVRQAAHNSLFETWLNNLDFRLAVCDVYSGEYSPEHLGRMDEEHCAILDAVAAGDAELARVTQLEHSRRYQEFRMRLLAQRGIPASAEEFVESAMP
jgi:DNA-binding GntR family transcriptional regulator